MNSNNLSPINPTYEIPAETEAAIDKALAGQLVGISQAMGIIKLTIEAFCEPPEDDTLIIASAYEALSGAHALLDNARDHLESVDALLVGEGAIRE